MSDVEKLVDADSCQLEHEKANGVYINVAPISGNDNIGYQHDILQPCPTDKADNEQMQDFIMAIFVVVFDTRRGNEIEWEVPGSIDLEGVEFKALVSGSHTVTQDFVYFKHKSFFGLSCYGKLAVENEEERHARMKSVGIICTKYTSLHKHLSFLERQVRLQLEMPRRYEDLLAYYKNYRNCPQRNNSMFSFETSKSTHYIDDLPILKITHPEGCFSQFIRYFGEKIFVLWKLILLQKRILYFSPPPAGIASYRVYCTCLLGSHAVPIIPDWNTNPLFSVNVCDIAMLSTQSRYVACTTDKIFETKQDVYDAFVDNQNLHLADRLALVGKINGTDRKRYQEILSYSNRQLIAGNDVSDDERLYTRFFVECNNRLFKILYEVSSRDDRTLTADDVYDMGLDPNGDRLFIAQIVELYDINVALPDVACC